MTEPSSAPADCSSAGFGLADVKATSCRLRIPVILTVRSNLTISRWLGGKPPLGNKGPLETLVKKSRGRVSTPHPGPCTCPCARFLMKLALNFCIQNAWCTLTRWSDDEFGEGRRVKKNPGSLLLATSLTLHWRVNFFLPLSAVSVGLYLYFTFMACTGCKLRTSRLDWISLDSVSKKEHTCNPVLDQKSPSPRCTVW